MKILGVVGHSDSGKTTLIERLVPAFEEYGRVATIKSIHHDIEIDTPGSDTDRHANAGAEAVVGITPSLTFEISRRGKEGSEPTAEVAALQRQLRRFQRRGYDFVLVEGFRQARYPKILVGESVPSGTVPEIVAHIVEPNKIDLDALVATFKDEDFDALSSE